MALPTIKTSGIGYWQHLEDDDGYSDYFGFYKIYGNQAILLGIRNEQRIETLDTHETMEPDIGYTIWDEQPPYATHIQKITNNQAGNLLGVWASKIPRGTRFLTWENWTYVETGEFDPDTGMPIEDEIMTASGRIDYFYFKP